MKAKKVIAYVCMILALVATMRFDFAYASEVLDTPGKVFHAEYLFVRDRNITAQDNSIRSQEISSFNNFYTDVNYTQRYTIEEISDMFNIGIKELRELQESGNYDEVITFLFSAAFDLPTTVDGTSSRSGGGEDPNAPAIGISTIQFYTLPGDIHITPQSSTWGLRHGHAALAVSNTLNLETYGGDDLSSVRSNNGWGNYNSYALYYVTSLTVSQINTAVNYGRSNLQGLEYSGLATVSAKKVNCASLIWKAFNDSGVITLDYLWGLPYAPKLITDAKQTDWVIRYNWAYPAQ